MRHDAFTSRQTDLEAEQKEGLKVLLRKHTHRAITPEIRRELFTSNCRHNVAPVGDSEPSTGGIRALVVFISCNLRELISLVAAAQQLAMLYSNRTDDDDDGMVE
jgi:hypothetical protein